MAGERPGPQYDDCRRAHARRRHWSPHHPLPAAGPAGSSSLAAPPCAARNTPVLKFKESVWLKK